MHAALAELAEGGRRCLYLHDTLEGISHKVFADALRRAERDELISRQIDPGSGETATLHQITDLCRSQYPSTSRLQPSVAGWEPTGNRLKPHTDAGMTFGAVTANKAFVLSPPGVSTHLRVR